MSRARVLVADDHVLIQEGLRRMLEPQYEVVGAVSDGKSLVDSALRLKPDLIVLDITMPLLRCRCRTPDSQAFASDKAAISDCPCKSSVSPGSIERWRNGVHSQVIHSRANPGRGHESSGRTDPYIAWDRRGTNRQGGRGRAGHLA